MTPVALALVLAAAVCHASWNLLLKRSGAGGPAFLWLFLALATVLYAPVAAAVVLLERPAFGVTQLLFMAVSGTLHLGYFLLLQRGYRRGDLSVVYPLARGTGPALSTAAAIAILGERPSPLALAGAALVVVGVVTLGRSPAGPGRGVAQASSLAVAYALLTGAFIAAYTLWDKHAVASVAIPPVLLDWASNLFRTALLGAVILPRFEEVRTCWKRWRREAVAVAVLSPLAYILVLTALVTTPVSYIAPTREVSIAIGAFLGIRLLGEQNARQRLLASAIILAGVIGLGLELKAMARRCAASTRLRRTPAARSAIGGQVKWSHDPQGMHRLRLRPVPVPGLQQQEIAPAEQMGRPLPSQGWTSRNGWQPTADALLTIQFWG